MVVKVYISQVSASKEIKKKQQRIQMILDSHDIKYELIDVTEPGHENEKEQMQAVGKKRDQQTVVLPPQLFNDDNYCGDFDDFDAANDEDKIRTFLLLES